MSKGYDIWRDYGSAPIQSGAAPAGLVGPTVGNRAPAGPAVDPTRPDAPKLLSAYDEADNIKSQFQYSPWDQQKYGVQYDPTGQAQWGLGEMKSRASSTAWEDMMSQKADEMAAQQKEQAAGAMQGQLAGARTQMQMRGGMSGGARERLATSGARAVGDQQAAIGRQNQLAQLGIGAQAQDRRDAMLGTYQTSMGQDLAQRATADSYTAGQRRAHDIGGLGYTTGLMGQENLQRSGLYDTGMREWGAGKTADALRASANQEDPGLLGMGGFLGTGLGGKKGLLGTGFLGG